MNKNEVFELIRDRYWSYQNVDDNGNHILIYLATSKEKLNNPSQDAGFILIKFEYDGSISYPTNISFIPGEMRRWDFDEESNEIVIFDLNGNESNRLGIPKLSYNKMTQIDYHNSKDVLISNRHTSRQVNTEFQIGGEFMYFLPTSLVNPKVFHDLNENYGFNVKAIRHPEHLATAMEDVYNYLVEHSNLKQVIIDLSGSIEIKLSHKYRLGVAFDEENHIKYFSGYRSTVLELITEYLIEHAKNVMMDKDDTDDYDLFQNIITTLFNERHEIIA